MSATRSILFPLLFSLAAAVALQSATPTLAITPIRMLRGGIVTMKGAGFTAKANVRSHLRRPDGTEFPILLMFTNDRGEISHDIETFILEPGVYEVWIEDETTKKTSEPARFEVTRVSVS